MPLWSRRADRGACSTKMPPLRSHKRRRVACQHFPDDQTLGLQAGAGEDDVIHLPSGLDHVDCERQEEEGQTDNKLKTSALCLSWSGTAAITRSGRAGKPQVRSGKTGMCQTVTTTPFLPSSHRLAGLVVKASASGAEDPGLESRWRRDFSGSSHTSDLEIGTPVATLPGVRHYRVSAGTGRFGVSIL